MDERAGEEWWCVEAERDAEAPSTPLDPLGMACCCVAPRKERRTSFEDAMTFPIRTSLFKEEKEPNEAKERPSVIRGAGKRSSVQVEKG